MDFIFGDTDEIVCQHSTGEYRFYPKANESFTMDKGGIRANDDANQVTASGDMMSQMNRVRWSFEGPVACDVINDTELKNLELLSKHPELGTWTFSLFGSVIYKGKGRPVGDQQYDTNAGTITLKCAGAPKLEKVS